jgi:NAD(P)-dependent dehydrogenase (short-subunit alcohol dehydrogenase family)
MTRPNRTVALVTGASTGIGRAFAEALAARALCVPGPLNQAGAAFASALPAGITRRLAAAVLPRVE